MVVLGDRVPAGHVSLCLFFLWTPAFAFYQRRRSSLGDLASMPSLLQPGPYVPQCNAFGSWEPVQCHAATGKWEHIVEVGEALREGRASHRGE